MTGCRLLLMHPEIAMRSCGDCITFMYHDGPDGFGDPVMRGGKRVKRVKGFKPPCQWCPKISPGDEPIPSNAQELTEQNFRAYLHYLECQAVGSWPNDPIVRRNAALIRHAEKAAERATAARNGRIALNMLMGN